MKISELTYNKLLQTLRRLTEHPLTINRKVVTLARYLDWQLNSRAGNPEIIKLWVEGLSLIVRRGYHASTACHYFGLPEFESMGFLLHFLKPADCFVDAGANIGAYSLLASGVCGAFSLAFEPDTNAAQMLLKNRALNHLESQIDVHETGLGASYQSLQMTTGKGIQNHISTQTDSPGTHIRIVPLDDFCKARVPVLIKIDVEGYETAVVKGAKNTLANLGVKALIVESMGLGQRYGFDEGALHQQLLSIGFQLFDYQPFTRKFHQIVTPIFGNNLYLRDVSFVENRVKNGLKININGSSF
ncbi:MAG: FkbM family methyltransferase [Saprospiraceae bacterium]|nr:FkbM family methyltransferase [Saprospiraceae bacterium]